MTVWRNPDQERTNQNARIYLKTTLPYNKYMLFAGQEVRIVKNYDRGLENAARGRRPRAAVMPEVTVFHYADRP